MFLGLVLLVILQRLGELTIARSNVAQLRRRGAQEAGAGHYPLMVALHSGWLLCMVWEWWTARSALDGCWLLLGWSFFLLGQSLRWWTIDTLGRRWTTRIMVLPGSTRVESGPFRILPHPNYLGVCLEIVGLPLIGGCWRTSILFGLLNLILLSVRIRTEEQALKDYGCLPKNPGNQTS